MTLKFAVVALALVVSPASFAAKGGASTATASSKRSSSSVQYGLGVLLASSQAIGTSASGLSAVLLFNQDSWLQANFVLPSTSPFAMMIGADYRVAIAQGRAAGFHVGGGFAAGSVAANGFSTTGFSLNGLAGIHVRIPEVDNLLFAADAGPTLVIANGAANFAATFLGLSAHYIF